MGKHEEKGQRQKDGPSRGRNPRTTPVRGIGPEGSRLVWSAAGVYCGRRQSADSCPKSRVLMGQTADHGCGLKPSALSESKKYGIKGFTQVSIKLYQPSEKIETKRCFTRSPNRLVAEFCGVNMGGAEFERFEDPGCDSCFRLP
ncbi:hypothetical protein YC2023_005911 [Brassica napus]